MTTATLPPQVNAFLEAYAAQPAMLATHAELDLTDAIDRMRIEDTPFTYGIVDDFLPKAVYEAILRDWPAPSAFRTSRWRSDAFFHGTQRMSDEEVANLAEGKSAGELEHEPAVHAPEKYISRKTRLIEDTADPSQDPVTGVWNQVAEALRAPSLIREVFARFAAVIDAHLTTVGDTTGRVPSHVFSQSVDHGANEALGAHLDTDVVLLTIVIYIDLQGAVNQDSEQLWGTSLYNPVPGVDPQTLFIPNADLEPATRVGFVPNRAFLMPNSSRSLHGVAGGQPDVQRRILMTKIWLR
jgi:hypothetical protein